MRATSNDSTDTSETLDAWGRAPSDPNYGVDPGGGGSANVHGAPAPNGLGVVSGVSGTTPANGGLVTYDPAKVWPGQGGPGTVGPTGRGAPLSNATEVQNPQPNAVVTPPPEAVAPPVEVVAPPEAVAPPAATGGAPAAVVVPPTSTPVPPPVVVAPPPPPPAVVPPPPTPLDNKSDALYQALLKRAQQSLVVDPNDPVIKGQTDAYNVQDQRARADYLRSLAEQQGPNGNIGAEGRASAEKVGQDVAGFQGTLVSHELQSRRDEIQQALTGMQGMLSDEQKLAMQKQLDELDNAVKYAQLNEQGAEFNQSQGQQESQFGRTLAQQLQLALASLAQGSSQFSQSLGQRAYEYDQTRQDQVVGGL